MNEARKPYAVRMKEARAAARAIRKIAEAERLRQLTLIADNLVGRTVTGNDQHVIVAHVRNETDGQRLADRHCKQFGKSAQFNRMEGTRAIYDCQSGSQMAR